MVTLDPVSRRRQGMGTAVGLLVGGLAYALTLLQFGTDPTRTATGPGYFSGFFDLQARSLLAGHLWVPDGSLGIEGFLHGGRTYTYFPPFPAVLRMPVLMTTHEYDGRLTVLSMALAWVVFAAMTTKLVWLVTGRIGAVPTGSTRPADGAPVTVSRLRAVVVAIFLAAATGGSFLTFDASLPWVYHEVYVWAVAAGVGGAYWLTRLLLVPDRHAVWWLFWFALVAVGTRATEGWSLCLVVIALAVVMRWRPRWPEHRRLWWRTLLAGGLPLAVSIAINEAKFRTIYIFPLQDQVWTQVNHHRQVALAANGGSLTGPQFLRTALMAYWRPDGVRFVDYFPWITLPARAARPYGGAVLDQAYRTGSVPALMPVLLLLLVVAAVACFRPRAAPDLRSLRWPLAFGVLVTGGVMDYGYFANRYNSDFVPALVVGGAIGVGLLDRALTRALARNRTRSRARVPDGRARVAARGLLVPVAVGALALGSTYSILAQVATGLSTAAYTHRGDLLVRYVDLQHRLSPDAIASRTSRVDGLPQGGRTDDLAVRGDCEALYVNTGDSYEPWVPVQERDQVIDLRYDVEGLRPGTATLATVTTTQVDRVDVQVDDRRRMRFVVHDDGEATPTAWFDPPTTGDVGVGIRDQIDAGAYLFEATPGGSIGALPSTYFDNNQLSLPSDLDADLATSRLDALAALGIRASQRPGLPLALCTSLARAAGIDVGTGTGTDAGTGAS